MPRMRQSIAGNGSHASSSLLAVDRILQKETSFRSGIETNHSLSKVIAERISLQGEVEEVMLASAADEHSREDIVIFLQQQRDRLKNLAESNIRGMRSVDAFCQSLQGVREQVVGSTLKEDEDQQTTQADDGELPDYEAVINQKMEEYQTNKEHEQLNLRDEPFCREIRARLGEKEEKKQKKKRGRNSNTDDDDDDDDELEVLRQPEGTQSLKCPITSMYFDEPMKSKTCQHVYSKTGLVQLMGQRQSCRCPVAGCSNNSVTWASVENDIETELKVKSQLRKEDREKQQRRSQAMAEQSDDEDVL